MATATSLVTNRGRSLRLGPELARGGEGAVFHVEGQPDVVAKLYHEVPSGDKAAKLSAMAAASVEKLLNVAAWPQETLHDRPGAPARGFLMRKIASHKDIHVLYGTKTRAKHYPEATYRFLVAVAANVARAFAVLHELGHVIGDVNQGGVCVSTKGTVSLVDCDSFQVTAGGRVFGCDVGIPTYQPPELQSATSFRGLSRTQNHDRFGLAVLIFQTLFLARHPFSGTFLGNGDMPIERAISEFRFVYAQDAGRRQMKQPMGSLGLGAVTPLLARLFESAFLEQGARGARPSALEWVAALDAFAGELKDCSNNAGHAHRRDLQRCPLCDLEANSGVLLFAPPRPASVSALPVSLEDLWRAVVTSTEQARAPTQQEILSLVPPFRGVSEPHHLRRGVVERRRAFETEQERLVELQKKLSSWPARVAKYERSWKAVLVFGAVTFMFFGIMSALRLPLSLLGMILSAAVVAGHRLNRPMPESVMLERVIEQQRSTDAARTALHAAEVSAAEGEHTFAIIMSAHQRVNTVLSELEKDRASPRLTQFKQLEETARKAYAGLKGFAARRDQHMRAFDAQRQTRQMSRYLDQFEVKDCRLKGFGRGLFVALESNGIETADDLSVERLKQVPGFGAKRIEALMQWKQGLESRFRFNPNDPAEAQDRLQAERDQAQIYAKELDDFCRLVEQTKAMAAPFKAKFDTLKAQAKIAGGELAAAIPKAASLNIFSPQ